MFLLGVFREVFRGFSEEARNRGFPSPSFGGFGLIVVVTKYNSWIADRLPVTNVRFWPKADLNFGDFGYMKASALEKSGHIQAWFENALPD